MTEAIFKRCRGSGRTRPLVEFYQDPQMADGHLNQCAPCVRARVAAYRLANLQRIRAYDRARGCRVYDLAKVRARRVLTSAVYCGRLQRGPCSMCGVATHVDGHHLDYSEPLRVVWLCRAHHGEAHRRIAA